MEAQGYVEGYSYWTFSDIFEENYFNSDPFHGGFGLLTIYGIPKPSYRAYELLHRLGDIRFPVKGNHETVDVWVIKNKGCLQVLLTNSALPKHSIKTEQIKIILQIDQKIKATYLERIDDMHANATQVWIDMGRPKTLLPEQVKELEERSNLIKEIFAINICKNEILFDIMIPPQGVACITLEIE